MKKRFVSDATAEEQAFTPVPEGTYVAELCAIKPGCDKNGDDFWGVTLKVLSGPIDSPDQQYTGKLVFDFWSFSESQFAEARLKHRLRCLSIFDTTKGTEVELNPDDFLGRQCRIDTCISDYDGKKSAKVSNFGYSETEGNDEKKAAQIATAQTKAAEIEHGKLPF